MWGSSYIKVVLYAVTSCTRASLSTCTDAAKWLWWHTKLFLFLVHNECLRKNPLILFFPSPLTHRQRLPLAATKHCQSPARVSYKGGSREIITSSASLLPVDWWVGQLEEEREGKWSSLSTLIPQWGFFYEFWSFLLSEEYAKSAVVMSWVRTFWFYVLKLCCLILPLSKLVRLVENGVRRVSLCGYLSFSWTAEYGRAAVVVCCRVQIL